jgi:hypothetical protein
MENQPIKPVKTKKLSLNPTFQDKLYATWKIFWKAGYAYRHTGKQEDFYASVLEDMNNLDLEEFLEKYGN